MPAALDDVRQRRANGAPDAEQVDVDRLLDGLRSDKPQRPTGGDPGVGDRDIEAAEPVGEVLHGGGQRHRVAHVRNCGFRAAKPGTDTFQAVVVDIDQPDPHAARGQLPASSAPMPDAPPVINAVRPSRLHVM